MKTPILMLVACALCPSFIRGAEMLTTVAELENEIRSIKPRTVPYQITAHVLEVTPPLARFTVGDAAHALRISPNNCQLDYRQLRPGDTVRLKGVVSDRRAPSCREITFLGHDSPPMPNNITGPEFYSTDTQNGFVRLRGTVRSVLPDEIDPNFCFLVLSADAEGVPVSAYLNNVREEYFQSLLGSEIEVSGFFEMFRSPNRPNLGRLLLVNDTNSIVVLDKPQADPFAVPDLSSLTFLRPSELLKFGRFRTVGTVVAAWDRTHVLLRTDDGEICRADLARGELPARGMRVEASGFPETDFYHVNLSCAICRPADGTPDLGELSTPVSPEGLFERERKRIAPRFHGKTVTFEGVVGNVDGDMLEVDYAGHALPVNTGTSGTPGKIASGSRVQVTGTCVLDTVNWRADNTFPRIQSIFVITHTAADIRVISNPSWWTRARLLTAVGALLAVLFAILLWSMSLRRLAARRGLQLAATTIAKTESDLKVYERTRLATELHDSLAQVLTGVAFELETADRLAETNADTMRKHLDIAMKSLQACRDSLRNCLWDLRNQALEIPEMDKAIRRTLEQHLGDAALNIRFNVPRERLSDNTTHEILCIVRELAINSIRHGHATEIRIAGAIEADALRFSVTDNGTGFDPAKCPGMKEGHYGLQGVRERAANLNGDFSIQRVRAGGMKAVVSIRITQTQASEQ